MKRIFTSIILSVGALVSVLAAENQPPALPDADSTLPSPAVSVPPIEPPQSTPSEPPVATSLPTLPDAKAPVPSPTPESLPQKNPTSPDPQAISTEPASTPLSLENLERLTALMKENQALQEQLEQSRGGLNFSPQPRSQMPQIDAGASNEPARKELITFLRSQYNGTNVDVYLQGEYVVVRIPEATYRVGQVNMPMSIRSRLKPIADAAAKFESKFDLQVEGHSDATPVRRNSGKSNWTVAFARAEAVARELETLKVPDRSLAITSRGSGLLADQNNKFADLNRRVELVFAPKRSVDPVPKVPTKLQTTTPPAVVTTTPQKGTAAVEPAPVPPSALAQGPTIRVSDSKDSDPGDIIDLPVLVVNAPPNETATPNIPQPVR